MIDNIDLKINGKKTKVNIVRYFLNSEQRYLIYTLGEKDDAGYIKLYVSKMEYNPLKAVSITDDEEWGRIKDLIKTTIKENKQNSSLSITDLNYSEIDGIEVVDSKIFKLLDSMVEILSSNKKLFEDYSDVIYDNTLVPDEEEKKEKKTVKEEKTNEDGISYKDLYLQEIENRKLVEKDLKKAIEIIEKFREKVDEINKLLK